MTRVRYPDLKVTSGNEEYRAEALSSGNQFRYRLLDRHEHVLWEYWLESPRPHQLYLADDGWLVVRTHDWGAYYLIAVSPTGQETVRLAIIHPEMERPTGPVVLAPNALLTTAGMLWARAALTFFLSHEGDRYFSVWPSWGERFVINLTRGELAPGPSEAIAALEEEFAEDLLTSSNPCKNIFACQGVIGLIQRRRIERLVPLLQALWRSNKFRKGSATNCDALHGIDRTTREPLPALCLVLASLGALEPGPACYSFHPGWGAVESTPLPRFPRKIQDRPERIKRLSTDLNSLQVLKLVGCPDHIEVIREQHDQDYVWVSQWDYYTQAPLEVTRILWEPDSHGTRMRSLQRLPFTAADVEERLGQLLRS